MMSKNNEDEESDAAIIDTRQIVVDADNYWNALARLDTTWSSIERNMNPLGSLYVLARNWYDRSQGELLPFAHDLIARVRACSDLRLRNVLVVYREMSPKDDGKPLAYGHFLIPFFVKSLGNYYFDKDSIREPHIFKDIEWGKRKRGKSGYSKNGERWRYSPKGRDPGNVFYKTSRDAKGYILAVNETTDAEIYQKLARASTKKGGTIASNIQDSIFQSIIAECGRKLIRVELIRQ